MDWKKVQEQVVTVIISGLLLAFGGTVVWAVTVILEHERNDITQAAEIELLKRELSDGKKINKEMLTITAEELHKLRKQIAEKPPESITPWPAPNAAPPMQSTDEYKGILRDKFEQRMQQIQQQR